MINFSLKVFEVTLWLKLLIVVCVCVCVCVKICLKYVDISISGSIVKLICSHIYVMATMRRHQSSRAVIACIVNHNCSILQTFNYSFVVLAKISLNFCGDPL